MLAFGQVAITISVNMINCAIISITHYMTEVENGSADEAIIILVSYVKRSDIKKA